MENGVITEADLDEKCRHILQTYAAFGFLDNPTDVLADAEDPALSQKRAYEVALEGPVLLKNEEGILPLKPGKKNLIVVTGPNAHIMACGGGSGWVQPEDGKGVTPAAGLQALGKNWNVQAIDSPSPEVLRKAAAVIVCVGYDSLSESENMDRKYTLPKGQDDLILRMAKYNDNVVVVANSGGEFDLSAWQDRVKAILLTWYPGQEGGNALAAILSGKVSPSGRLPFTFWGAKDKNPAQKWYDVQPQIHKDPKRQHYNYTTYGEGVFLGYRGVEHFGVTPLYPFGFGLSYTTFDYADASVVPDGDGFDVSFTVRNTGMADAKEVAQVYVAPVNAAPVMRPAKELKGYDKKFIVRGGQAHFTIHLDRDAFSYYDVQSHRWVVAPGQYKILIGPSSADAKLELEITL